MTFERRTSSPCLVLALAGALLLASGCTTPRSRAERARDSVGPFVGLHGAFAVESFDLERGLGVPDLETTLGGEVELDDAYGAGAELGHRFSPTFALALEFETYTEFDIDVGPSQVAAVDVWSAFLIAHATLPSPELKSSYRPYFRFGLGVLAAEIDPGSGPPVPELGLDERDVALSAGLGFDYALGPGLDLYVEASYLRAIDDLEDFDLVPIRIGLRTAL